MVEPKAGGSGISTSQPQGSSVPPPPSPPSDQGVRRGRPRWLLIGGVVLAVLVGLGILLDKTVLTHDLLDADFEAGAEPFQTEENDTYTVDIVDGTYRIKAKAGPQDAGSPLVSFAWFARTVFAVHAEVTVVDPGAGILGILCVHESAATWDSGFGFLMGGGEAILTGLSELETTADTYPIDLRPGQRIGINCNSEFLTMDFNVEGLVDGEVISTLSNDDSTGFNRLALWFWPDHEGDSARFDNVTARVP